MFRSTYYLAVVLAIGSIFSFAKKQDVVLMWPPDKPTLKLTFGPFHDMGAFAGAMSLVSDVVVENLTTKVMPRASFNVSLIDPKNIRVGDGLLVIDDLNPGQSARIQFQCRAVGQPATLNIAAHNSGGVPVSPKMMIPITIISVPPGAALKVDDKPVRLTPITVRVVSGTHNLELQKEGYAVARTPLDVNPDEAPGGSITITLGDLANDTIELRDGSILTGDVISMNLESVVISVQGTQQSLDRNKIKKIFLVERVVTHTVVGSETPPATATTPTNVQAPHP
jgi:hypothetical protein